MEPGFYRYRNGKCFVFVIAFDMECKGSSAFSHSMNFTSLLLMAQREKQARAFTDLFRWLLTPLTVSWSRICAETVLPGCASRHGCKRQAAVCVALNTEYIHFYLHLVGVGGL